MRRLLALTAIIAIAAAVIFPVASQAAGNFSDWKCSQCGMTRHMAGQKPPTASGCKVSGDGKHIWFRN